MGTPQTTLTVGAKDPIGTATTATLAIAGWRAEDVGKYIRVNSGLLRITAITSSTVAQVTIEVELTSIIAAPALAWTLEGSMWGGAFGYPRCGTFFEQRHWLAGSPGWPTTLWGSTIGEPLEHRIGPLDDEAMAVVIGNGEANPILHLANARGLVVLATGGEFSVQGGDDRALTPTNLKIKDQSNFGCSRVAPVRAGQEIYSRSAAAASCGQCRRISTTPASTSRPTWRSWPSTRPGPGLSPGLPGRADALLWGVRSDGVMATLTADRDQEVFAWARQITQGAFEDVSVCPTEAGANVFVVVARTVGGVTTRYIEMFEAGLHLDSAITGTSAAGATTWAGLGHLEGRRVRAKGDGIYLGEFVVTGGAITLPRAAFKVEIGLDYVTTIKTLTPEIVGPGGSIQGGNLSINEVTVKLLETTGLRINLQDAGFRQLGLGVLDKPPPLYTGNKSAGNLGWGKGTMQTLIQQTLPYPMHVLSVLVHLTANDG